MLSNKVIPEIIAHRAGGGDWPQNTLFAIRNACALGIKTIEIDVQVNIEGTVVLYHPADLSELTNGAGSVANASLVYLKSLDAAYHFNPESNYPLRNKNITIPALYEILENNAFKEITFIIDMKSLPAKDLINALVKTIPLDQYSRLLFYSTNEEHLEFLSQVKPIANQFEARILTKQRLLDYFNTYQSGILANRKFIGFELVRSMSVTEQFALGSSSNLVVFKLWTKDAVRYTRSQSKSNLILIGFGVNDSNAYEFSKSIGLDAIYTDYPYELLKNDVYFSKLLTNHNIASINFIPEIMLTILIFSSILIMLQMSFGKNGIDFCINDFASVSCAIPSKSCFFTFCKESCIVNIAKCNK